MSQLPNIDPTSPAAKANPYPAYALVRANDPVYRLKMENGQSTWLITRYEDAQAVLKDQRFVKDFRRLLTPEQLAQRKGDLYSAMNTHMLVFDPPDHTRLRALVNISFTPRLVEQWRERIQTIAHELIDAMEQQSERELDLIDAFAFPLPMIVITEMLGVPAEDRAKFREWSNALLDGVGNSAALPHSEKKRVEFAAYLSQLIEIKRQQPGDDLIGRLLVAEADGDKLNQIELMSMIFLLLIAGHETTVNLLGNSVLALIQNPAQRQLLQEHPALIKNAVEEFLRFHSPVAIGTNRWAGEDLEFGGKQMRRGDVVLVGLASANHDAEEFAHPDELDITRPDNRHLAFGLGIHYCLGAPLARLEGQIAINALLQRLPNLRLTVPVEELVWRPSLLLLGLSKLPVAY